MIFQKFCRQVCKKKFLKYIFTFFHQKEESVGNSFQVPSGSERGKKAEGIEILAESLTQQPNLSQGWVRIFIWIL